MVILPSKAAASPTKKKLASRSVHHRPSLLSCGVRASCLPMVLKRCCSAHYFSGTMPAHRHAHQHALVVRQLTNYWWFNVLGPFFPVQQTKQKNKQVAKGTFSTTASSSSSPSRARAGARGANAGGGYGSPSKASPARSVRVGTVCFKLEKELLVLPF